MTVRPFEALAREVRERLISFVRSRLGRALRGKLEPEDVAQEAFLRAFEAIHAFQSTDVNDFWKWLANIAEHLIWNASRKRSLKEVSLTREGSDPGVSPSRGLRRRERLERLEESLSTLKPDQREVIILSKIEGLRAKEIASTPEENRGGGAPDLVQRPEGPFGKVLATRKAFTYRIGVSRERVGDEFE